MRRIEILQYSFLRERYSKMDIKTRNDLLAMLYTQCKETETKILAVRWATEDLDNSNADLSGYKSSRDKILLALYERLNMQFLTLLANLSFFGDEEREKAKEIVKQRYMSSVSSFQSFMDKSGFHQFAKWEDAEKAYEVIFPRVKP